MENKKQLPDAIPIINYHKIEKNLDIGITTRTPGQFAADLHFLHENNYQTVTFKDLKSGIKLSSKALIITFDDAYESFYKVAYPLLRQYNFSAVVYVPLNYLRRWNDWDVQYYGKKYKHLNKDQLLEIHHGGMEIGSHTLSHRLLTALDKAEAEKEIFESKEKLENMLNDEVLSISYPFSRFNDNIMEISEKAGYRYGVASLYYRRIKAQYRHLCLKRFNIYRIDGEKVFKKKAENKKVRYLTLRDWLIQKGGRATNIHQMIKQKA